MLFPISLEPSLPYQSPLISQGREELASYSQDWAQRQDVCIAFPSLAFPFGEKDYLEPSFDMVCLLALWTQLLLVSLVTCKVKSFDLYLKKLPCNTVYILLQNSIKHPLSTRDLGPRVLLSLSLYLYFWLIPWSSKAG